MKKLLALVALSACPTLLTACSSKLEHHLSVRPTTQQLRDGDVKDANEGKPGERFDLSRVVVPGKYTVVEFESPY